VINSVSKDKVTGYLSTPKATLRASNSAPQSQVDQAQQ
jgi:hypothetical protein